MENLKVEFNQREQGQCHNCKHNIEIDKLAEQWYDTKTVPYLPSTIINPELKCDCRERCKMFDDFDNLAEFDKQGYVWVLPLEWIDDDAECELHVAR